MRGQACYFYWAPFFWFSVNMQTQMVCNLLCFSMFYARINNPNLPIMKTTTPDKHFKTV